MRTMTIPLIKLLTETGLGSRRKMADAIREGKVKVNGVVAESFTQPVDPHADAVMFEGKKVQENREQSVYLMLHKPKGLLTTTGDERGRETVFDILPEQYKSMRLYPVGRLDKDTTGLLLLTNDGELTHKLTHPSFEKEKEYLVRIEGKLTPGEKQQLTRGINLEDGVTSPAAIREIRATSGFNYSLVIHEGKKRQIRRMFAHLGYTVLELKRVRLGKLILGNLQEGETRPLTPLEVRNLRLG
ncbi:MAG: pseudouridine synthase [Dehalococcoidales bacterium]|nr:pseudouridine synthase [Dehalococcoidales bacterium]